MNEADISWFYNYEGNKKGPFTTNDIDALIRAGVLNEHTKMWSETLGEWTPLFRTELRTLLGDKTIQPPPLPADEAPVRPLTGPDTTMPLYRADDPIFQQPVAATKSTPHTHPSSVGYSLYDNQTFAKALRWMILINGFISGVQALMIVKAKGGIEAQYRLTKQLESDEIVWINAVPFLITVVAFLWWKYRSTNNLFRLRGPQTITPAGAIYWYFVPIAWFWKPYEAMRNLNDGYGADDQSGLLFWWLFFWGGLAAALVLAAIVPDPVQTISHAQTYAWGSIAIYAIDALWCWVAAELVKAISAAEAKALGQL